MELYNGLPIFMLEVSDGDQTGVSAVSLVDNPAIKNYFQAFSEDMQMFSVANEERRIISGPLMIPDTPIYRDDKRGKYYAVFSKDGIEKTVIKFNKSDKRNTVNLMHKSGQEIPGLTMFESFISDVSRGIPAMRGYENLPDGTWFGSFKVENEDVWNEIKESKFKGFSIEGFFSHSELNNPTGQEDGFSEIKEDAKVLYNTINTLIQEL